MTQTKTQAQQLAAFAVRASYQDLSDDVRDQLKIRVLDSLACAIAALGTGPIQACRQQVDEFGRGGQNTLIGGGTATFPYAAFYLTALVRYVDFMDNFLGVTETCHTADNFGSVLAAADYAHSDSQTFMTALALAYQVQSRLTASAPIMAKGFDHTTTLSYSISAGVSRLLGLNEQQAANAIGICGTDNIGFAIARAGQLSQWKGLASSQMALGCTHDVRLAQRGVTGPLTVFEGPKGLDQQMGMSIEVDWEHEPLDIVPQTTVKRYNSEIHTQSAIECALQLKLQQPFSVDEVQHITLSTFQVAYDFAGGGAYGDKSQAQTKEQADHSLPYLIAVALLDGDVMPAQFTQERIMRQDVQSLMKLVKVHPDDALTKRYPKEMPSHIEVQLNNSKTLSHDVSAFAGFPTQPMSWQQIIHKFEQLSAGHVSSSLGNDLVSAVQQLEHTPLADLLHLLRQVSDTSSASAKE